MTEENKIKNKEEKELVSALKEEEKAEKEKAEALKEETKTEEKLEEVLEEKAEKEKELESALKKEEKVKTKEKIDKKKKEKEIVKKEEAIAFGRNLHLSKKHGVYICSFIKNKKINEALKDLEEVKKFKRAVPFKGEIPHRKGKGMMSGRYPIKGAGLFTNILKALRGNVIVNGLDLDKTTIYFASASWSSRPMRSNRRQGKRTNVILKAREMIEVKK